jgi:hypothetical protein
LLTLVGKWGQVLGQMKYFWRKQMGDQAAIIEYKSIRGTA